MITRSSPRHFHASSGGPSRLCTPVAVAGLLWPRRRPRPDQRFRLARSMARAMSAAIWPWLARKELASAAVTFTTIRLRRKPRSSPVFRLNDARKPSTTSNEGPLCRGHEPQRPEAVLRERARADPLAVGSLPRRVLSRDRKKAPAPTPDHRALVERADDLRCLGVDQARGVELLVRGSACRARRLRAAGRARRWSPAGEARS